MTLTFAKALTRTATTYVRRYGRYAQPGWAYSKKVLDARARAEGKS